MFERWAREQGREEGREEARQRFLELKEQGFSADEIVKRLFGKGKPV
jgi:hypothetical protein